MVPDLAGPLPVAASPCASSRHRGCLRSSYAANRSRAAAAAQAVIGVILLVTLLGVMLCCAQMLPPLIPVTKPFRTILRVLIILLYVLVVLLGKRQLRGRDGLAADRRLDRRPGPPAVNHSSTIPHYVSGMDETQTLALQALRELLDNPDRGDWDKLVAASHTLIKAIETVGMMYSTPFIACSHTRTRAFIACLRARAGGARRRKERMREISA